MEMVKSVVSLRKISEVVTGLAVLKEACFPYFSETLFPTPQKKKKS